MQADSAQRNGNSGGRRKTKIDDQHRCEPHLGLHGQRGDKQPILLLKSLSELGGGISCRPSDNLPHYLPLPLDQRTRGGLGRKHNSKTS